METLAEKKASKKPVKKTARKTESKKATTDLQFVLKAVQIARDRRCSDIVALDLRGISPATDYFVLATSTSGRQAKTVADEISEEARKYNLQRFGRAGYEQGQWILLDFINVVVHLFDSEFREYYNLEMLWGDAKRLPIDD